MSEPIPMLDHKVTIKVTARQLRRFKSVSKAHGLRLGTWVRTVLLREIERSGIGHMDTPTLPRELAP